MKTVDKHLFSNFLKPFFVCIVSFIGILFFVDSAEKLRPFISYSYSGAADSFSVITSYIFGRITVYFVDFLPFVIALSGAITHVNLNKTGQLMALYSFGLNHHRIFRFPLLLSFGIGVFVLFLNISFLPNTIREVENTSRLIRGLPNKNKAFIIEEKISSLDQNLELDKNNLNKEIVFPIILNPPVFQIINYSEMKDVNLFKKIIITRLDVSRKIRQRFLLINCAIENGFAKGESGIMQDYNPNGDLFKETTITKEMPVYLKVQISGGDLVEMISLYNSPKENSLFSLMENYQLKVARAEVYRRLFLPIECVLLLLLSLAFSSLLNLKSIYMCFTVMILVALTNVLTSFIPMLFFANTVTVLPAFIAPVLLYLTSKIIFRKARI